MTKLRRISDRPRAANWCAVFCLSLIAAATIDRGMAAETDSAAAGGLPPFSSVSQLVLTRLVPAGGSPRDIISRQNVGPVFDELAALGWTINEREQLLSKVPSEGDFLVVQLRTPDGRKFMRKLGGLPLGYDRLDRLSRLPRGERTVKDLIRGADGYKLVEYLTTAKGGRELGRMLGRTPKGEDFNAPTGRLYTAESLLAQLKRLHIADELAAR